MTDNSTPTRTIVLVTSDNEHIHVPEALARRLPVLAEMLESVGTDSALVESVPVPLSREDVENIVAVLEWRSIDFAQGEQGLRQMIRSLRADQYFGYSTNVAFAIVERVNNHEEFEHVTNVFADGAVPMNIVQAVLDAGTIHTAHTLEHFPAYTDAALAWLDANVFIESGGCEAALVPPAEGMTPRLVATMGRALQARLGAGVHVTCADATEGGYNIAVPAYGKWPATVRFFGTEMWIPWGTDFDEYLASATKAGTIDTPFGFSTNWTIPRSKAMLRCLWLLPKRSSITLGHFRALCEVMVEHGFTLVFVAGVRVDASGRMLHAPKNNQQGLVSIKGLRARGWTNGYRIPGGGGGSYVLVPP